MSKVNSSSGQASVEFLITGLGFLSLFILVLSLAWLVLTNYQIESQMQSLLICISAQAAPTCEIKLKKDLNSLLLWGNIKHIRTENGSTEIRTRLQYQWQNKLGLHFEKEFFASMQK